MAHPAHLDATDATPGLPRRPAGVGASLLLLPLVLWLAAFVVAPTAIMFVYSFGQRDGLGQVVLEARDGQGRLTVWDNYRRVFDPDFNPRKPDHDPGRLPAYVLIAGRGAAAGAVGAAVLAAIAAAWTRWRGDVATAGRAMARAAAVGFAVGFVYWFDRELEMKANPLFAGGGNFLKILWRSVKYAAYTTAICVAAGYPVAYFVGRASERSRNKLLMAVMIPFWTSFLIRTYAWITILRGEGLLNGLVDLTGVSVLLAKLAQLPGLEGYVTDQGRLDLMYTPLAIMVGLVYAYLPFMILPIYGSVEKLDPAMVEAAFDLGAGPVRAFWRVIVPL
ncbi:MAG TPA: ABC transporter permease, partial [Tepidisphaeraceae bacterium]|nr:ABC transporter permease [Tepidisphaeraceae bacterium]